jgi:hypothetical protein
LATNIGAAARPFASLVDVTVRRLPGNVPLAPEAGAVKVTTTPATAFPVESLTLATIFAAKAVLTCALWGVPAAAVTLAADPDVFVSAKVAGVATPGTVALIV